MHLKVYVICLECRLHLRKTSRVSQEEKFETQVRTSGVDMEVDMFGDTLSQPASPWVAIKLLPVDPCCQAPGSRPTSLRDAGDGVTVTPVNEDTAKLLAKLGYPQIEEGEKPSNLLPRCIACVTKRLKKMAEMMPSADPNADGQAPGQAGDGKDADADAKKALAKKTWPYHILHVHVQQLHVL